MQLEKLVNEFSIGTQQAKESVKLKIKLKKSAVIVEGGMELGLLRSKTKNNHHNFFRFPLCSMPILCAFK